MQTTFEIAIELDLSARRVRQIIKKLGIEPEKIGGAFVLSRRDVQLIKRRNRKPGPRANGKR